MTIKNECDQKMAGLIALLILMVDKNQSIITVANLSII